MSYETEFIPLFIRKPGGPLAKTHCMSCGKKTKITCSLHALHENEENPKIITEFVLLSPKENVNSSVENGGNTTFYGVGCENCLENDALGALANLLFLVNAQSISQDHGRAHHVLADLISDNSLLSDDR